ncbi:uridylate-specific endoribonuclease-like isoform X1 [Biomphalaria glabrata]|uniref:Uridylate-specific endoribonuclease n=1 Tax=Biomphalaria glabrata TaxID=6526 RepID=A0A9W2Z8N9_BIOGL|nr:uridylate-specific endoribonuclease-like isoform X1 [Biomphalaria glabrata]XP_055871281.1 uridylate-specific endoribonuclease-like isoform X1 [Biomphalaria glabrata]XP_055871282.1 uridylate-specific endoribonuclease-like isoform X1 [Biomphalaria glabrata]
MDVKLLLLLLQAIYSLSQAFLIEGGSCQGRCNSAVDSTKVCQCNTACLRYNDCCSDYHSLCVEDTCHNRCNAAHDASKICQCNSACLRFNDCCSDYTALCAGGTTVAPSSATCQSLTAVSNELWANDVNRLSGADITVNYQTQVADGTTSDRSSGKFFTHVNEAKLGTGTYKLLSDLFNNYDPTKGNRETATTQELNEDNAFLDAILATRVMASLLKFLQCKGIVHSQSELKTTLKKLWFDFYSRSGTGTTPDTSGFEHMMVGEYKDGNTVNGFHNWVSFYEKEKAGTLNYFGYVKKANPEIVGAAFSWANRVKTMGSFFIGVSPEFEIAVYSLCFLTNPGKACQISLNNIPVTIMSYSKDGHIATAYASERKIHGTVAPSGRGPEVTTEQNVQSSSHTADSPIHKPNRSKKRKDSKRRKKKVGNQLLTPHKVDELANHRNSSSGFEPDDAKIRNGKVQTKNKIKRV